MLTVTQSRPPSPSTPHELQVEPPIPSWRRFLAQFQDVLVMLLLIAAAISLVVWLYERAETLPYATLVTFALVLLNGILGDVQEACAELHRAPLPRILKEALPV